MDNIDWANINSFKKSEILTKAQEGENEEEEENDENDEDEEKLEVDDDDNDKDSKKASQMEMFKKILEHLKPGESILKAIKRLGSSSNKSSGSGGRSEGMVSANLSASQRWLKKKTTPTPVVSDVKDQEKARVNKEALEKLTGYSNYFIDRGFYDIYEETYESLETKIENSNGKPSSTADGDKNALDIFRRQFRRVGIKVVD